MSKLAFNYKPPVDIVFGPGRLSELGEIVSKYGNTPLLVLGESHASGGELLGQLADILDNCCPRYATYSGVAPNPTLHAVLDGVRIGREANVDMIIGVGGGSVMDTAKAISLGLTHDGDLWEYRIAGSKGISEIGETLPVVTVPTTAGSASEISPAALITHDGKKEVMVSQNMFPQVSLVDPALTVSLSKRLTAVSGYDCLMQGLEPLVASNSNLLSKVFARQTIDLVVRYLPIAIDNGKEIVARANMSMASIFGGLAISQSGVGAIHALAAPLTAYYNLSHGESLVPLTVPVIEFNTVASADEYEWAAGVIGNAIKGSSTDDIGMIMGKFIDRIGLSDMIGFRIQMEDVDDLVRDAQNPDLMTNPVTLASEEIRRIYQGLV